MRKNLIILMVVVVAIFLIIFLFLEDKSPIVNLACKRIASTGCYVDSCGSCSLLGKVRTECYFEDYFGRGMSCRKINDRCLGYKTWRTPVCSSLVNVYTKVRIKLGMENIE